MKTYKIFALILLPLFISFTGCSDDDDKKIIFDIESETLELPAEGLSVDIPIETNVTWDVESDQEWLTATKINENLARIEAGENYKGLREAEVTFTGTQLSAPLVLKVSQAKMTIEADSLALVMLHQLTGGENWVNKWDLDRPVEEWYGVKVENGNVYYLNLNSNGLTGTLPAELGIMSSLKICDLSNNVLEGTIPDFSKANELVVLDLSNNKLEGTIPASLSQSIKLEYINLRINNLEGTLPGGLNSLENLVCFDACANNLSGTIPGAWFNQYSSLKNLKVLYLTANQLSGEIPGNLLSNLPLLDSLALDHNNLTGTIPAEFGTHAGNLKALWLEYNNLDGTIPEGLLQHPLWDTKWKYTVITQKDGSLTTSSVVHSASGEAKLPPVFMNFRF